MCNHYSAKKAKLSASILSADFTRLGEEVKNVINEGIDAIHLDIMDHHFVNNLTFGPPVCLSLQHYLEKNKNFLKHEAILQAHLMVNPVNPVIESFIDQKINIDTILFHPETTDNIQKTIDLIRENHIKIGFAINPDESIEIIKHYIDQIDQILIMSVYPGFGGQKFIDRILKKISDTRELINNNKNNKNITLEVDGGVKLDNIKKICEAGADQFVLGSVLFHATNYHDKIQQFREILNLL